jgi:hypothetical protein
MAGRWIALTKETRLTEHTSLEFEVQAFNILNPVQLGDPGYSRPRLRRHHGCGTEGLLIA